jgi:membrane dipeptidase
MVRPPGPGELYKHHLERLAWMDELVAHRGVRRALCTAEPEAAHKAGQPAILADVEGLDFLEMKLERLEEAHQRTTPPTISAISRLAPSRIAGSLRLAPR